MLLRKRILVSAFTFIVGALSLTGCGQTGALSLPARPVFKNPPDPAKAPQALATTTQTYSAPAEIDKPQP
jgi:predicted small lipoprotein YifL